MSTVSGAPVAEQSRITGPVVEAALELKTFAYPPASTASVDLPTLPGALRCDSSGRITVLHFAPGRFLMPRPTPELERQVRALAAAGGGAVFDVDGKWRALTVTGPGCERLLSSGMDVAAVLASRGCAALHLFDCPVVIARLAHGFELWVQASYATDFHATLERIRGRLPA